jgi:hypothetical protein
MGGPTGHRIVQDGDDWMRQQEKRVLREERRPQITHASDLMGPGLGPRAVEVQSWSDPETEFNGFFYSRPSTTSGAPDTTSWWMGMTIAQAEGYGIQQVWDYRGTSSPMTMRTRRFSSATGTRVFSAWA